MAQDFLVIPIKLINDKRLQYGDAILYAQICYRSRLGLGCIESNKSLAGFLDEPIRTTRKRLERLEQAKYIKREFKGVEKYHRSRIIPVVGVSPEGHQNPKNKDLLAPQGHLDGLSVPHNNNKSNIYNINNTKSLYKPVDNSRVKGYKSVTELARKAGIKFR